MTEATFASPSVRGRGTPPSEWLEGIEFLPVPRASVTFAARVFCYVDASGDCWEWTGTKSDCGYGTIGRGARDAGKMPAHCAVWSLLVGPIPDGMEYDHLCRNHACCNPDHGEIVTPEENKRRGVGPAVLYAKRETCDKGHPLDGRLGGRGGKETCRYCKTCAREKGRAAYVPKGPRETCRNGHKWVPENIYTDPKSGKGACRICRTERQREARAATRRILSEAA